MTRWWTHLRTSPRSSSSGCQPAVLLEPSSQEPSSAPTLIWQWGRWPSIIMNVLRKPHHSLLLLRKIGFFWQHNMFSPHQWILLHRPQSAPLLRTTATALANKYLLLPAQWHQEVKLLIGWPPFDGGSHVWKQILLYVCFFFGLFRLLLGQNHVLPAGI